MRLPIAWALLMVACLLGTTTIVAKGATVRVVFSGGDLRTPIDVADPAALRPFNVWAGPGVTISGVPQAAVGFIVDWYKGVLAPPLPSLPRYEVAVHVDQSDHAGATPADADTLAYVITYAYDATSGHGYVFLPGRDDLRGALNMRSISRGGLEGNWLQSTPEWDAFAVANLPSARPN